MSTYNVHIKKWSEGNREITFPVTKGNGYFDFFLYGASTREFSGGGGQGVYQGLVDAFSQEGDYLFLRMNLIQKRDSRKM